MAQYSGALLFLQAQHQLSIWELQQSFPSSEVDNFLKKTLTDNLWLGVALFARKGIIQVERVDDGFLISDKLPWVTGFGFLSDVFFSFDWNDETYFTLLPFHALLENRSLLISDKIGVAVFNSTRTVSIWPNNYFIPQASIIVRRPIATRVSFLHPAVYNFAGAAKALLRLSLEGNYGQTKYVKTIYSKLMSKWESYYHDLNSHTVSPFIFRARGYELAEACATFARVACGASSLLSTHQVNRLTREIWQYTITGYSENQLEAYLREME